MPRSSWHFAELEIHPQNSLPPSSSVGGWDAVLLVPAVLCKKPGITVAASKQRGCTLLELDLQRTPRRLTIFSRFFSLVNVIT